MTEGRADVEILGQRLSVRGRGTPEYIHELADYLNGRIQTVRDQGTAAAAGGSFAPAGAAGPGAIDYWSPPLAYPHVYRRHYRIMNRIQRHHYRW